MKRLIILTIVLVAAQFLGPVFAQTDQKPEFIVQTGHTDAIDSISISPDGKVMASGSEDNTIKLWNIKTGQQLRSFEGHTDFVVSVAFSPDGTKLATGGYDKTVRLWDVKTGNIIKTLTVDSSGITSVAFSPDGDTIASGSGDKTVILWDLKSGAQEKLIGHRDSVNSVAFSPDGLLASGSGTHSMLVDGVHTSNGDNTIRLWDIKTRKLIKILEGHSSLIESITFSPNGKIIASGSYDGRIKLWNVQTGEQIRSLENSSPSSGIMSVAFSPDGEKIVSGNNENTISLWDCETGRLLKTFREGDGNIIIYSVTFSIDGKTIISASSFGTISSWSVETGIRIKHLGQNSNRISDIKISSDQKTMATISMSDDSIKLWSLATGGLSRSLKGCLETGETLETSSKVVSADGNFHSPVVSIAFSPEGKMIAAGCPYNRIELWDVETGKHLKSLESSTFSAYSMAFSPNGETFVTSGDSSQYDEKIEIWDLKKYIKVGSLKTKAVSEIAFSAGGETIVASGGTTVEFWNLKTKQRTKAFDGTGRIALSPNKKIIAIASNKFITLWDIETSQEVLNFFSGDSSIGPISFSNDGGTLVTGGSNHTITLWDVKTGQKIKSLKAHAKGVASLAFLPMKGLFFSGSYDGTVKLWSLNRKEQLLTLISLNEAGWVVVTPDGRFDTSKLENPQGLHWIMPDAPFTPVSFEAFMRDYYEPGLLPRLLKCTEQNNCDTEFKPVRNLADLNRTQPKVTISDITAATPGAVKVMVEVEDAVSEFQKDRTTSKALRSGVYDLRLFRDGQLVGYSTVEAKVKETFRAYTNFDEELAAWQAANRIELVNGKKAFTFNVKLPKNSSAKDFNFTAYAFNSDRVKSENANKTYTPPAPLARANGKAYLVTIGVNTSDNPAFSLRYAANDARKLQEVAGARLKAEVGTKYSEVIQVRLISDADTNDARKEIIRGVFAMLAGRGSEVGKETAARIAKIAKIPPVEPEDTVIIAFSGHGYADQHGIFYMLPADIPKGFTALTPDVLSRTISSDELSLWMRDITAQEMIMIVDACHSAAAVQGKDFKPGPMGSRGLGQLAYDKGMKILAATQTDNVAIELSRLEQGLLSYVLVKEGIQDKKADTAPIDKQLSATEWLSYAVKQVPLLYEDIRTGRRSVLVDGRPATAERGAKVVGTSTGTAAINLQQPSLFDFRRQQLAAPLFLLP